MNSMVAFHSQNPVEVGETYSVRLPAGVNFSLRAEHVRQSGAGQYLVVGSPLQQIPDEAFVALNGNRLQPRVPAVFRALSRELPGYQALTVDLSMGGLQLATQLPLELGERMPLSMDLPERELLVHCRVQIVWSRSVDGQYLAGCQFVDPDPETLAALKAFLRPRLGRLPEERPNPLQSIPVDATLEDYQVRNGKAELTIRFAREGTHHFTLEPLVGVDDHRSHGESQVGYLEHWKKGGKERWCLLSCWKEELVCFETSPGGRIN